MSGLIFRPIVRRNNPYSNYVHRPSFNEPDVQKNNEPKQSHTHVFANIMEMSDRFMLYIALPGFTTDEIKIEQHENKIIVKGNKDVHFEGKMHRQEFNLSAFERVFIMPADIQSDNIEAVYQNGILTLIILKAEVKAPKFISVK